MSTRRMMLLSATALALFSFPLVAAEHPDITGTWLLDATKSDFGPMPVPPDLVLRFNTAGREATNELPGGKMTSVHRWEGAALVGDIVITTGEGTKITFKDRSTWAADGKSMTTERQVSGPMGDGQVKMVLNRK